MTSCAPSGGLVIGFVKFNITGRAGCGFDFLGLLGLSFLFELKLSSSFSIFTG